MVGGCVALTEVSRYITDQLTSTNGCVVVGTTDFPCGAAYRAIRSPRTSSSSDLKRTFSPADSGSSLEHPASTEPGNQVSSAATTSSSVDQGGVTEQDLAKRAQRRVIDHKRSELEKKHELEKVRQTKLESEKAKKELASQVRLRRRAEIYALNAIMKQVQQAKIAAFLESQRRQQQENAESSQIVAPTPTLTSYEMLVQSIGV